MAGEADGGRPVKVAVMGTGAMGGYLGARLGTAGAGVTFIARGAHLAAIRTTGLRVSSPLGDVHVTPASATDDPAAVGLVDVVLLGVKLYDIEVAVRRSGPCSAPTPPLCVSRTASTRRPSWRASTARTTPWAAWS